MYFGSNEKPMRVLLVGAGAAGSCIADACLHAGWEVEAINRTGKHSIAGLRMHAVDVLDPHAVSRFSGRFDAVVGCLSGTGVEDEGRYRAVYVDGLPGILRRVDWIGEPKVVFLSSTGVYGEQDGAWVCEESPAVPLHRNGEVMLEAESAVRESVRQACCLRLSGLYGPGRTRLVRQSLRKGPIPKAEVWANQIRLEEVGRVVHFLLGLDGLPPVLHASDDCPATRGEICSWIREQKGCPEGELDEAHSDRVGRNRGNKRISNQKLRQLGYSFLYPDFRSGYADLLS